MKDDFQLLGKAEVGFVVVIVITRLIPRSPCWTEVFINYLQFDVN